MLESCAIAYLKEFFIVFMLFLIPILPCDANSVIFTIKMKSLTPQICQEKSPFKKSKEISTVKRSTFRLPTEMRKDFIKEFLWPYGKQFEAPSSKCFYCIIKRFEESGVTGRGQIKEDLRKHQACIFTSKGGSRRREKIIMSCW